MELPSGTVMVKDIRSGFRGSSLSDTSQPLATPSISQANDGTNGNELWKSDGTASGTVMVKDINSGSGQFTLHFTAIGNTSISQPPTEPTESNCGRVTELKAAR